QRDHHVERLRVRRSDERVGGRGRDGLRQLPVAGSGGAPACGADRSDLLGERLLRRDGRAEERLRDVHQRRAVLLLRRPAPERRRQVGAAHVRGLRDGRLRRGAERRHARTRRQRHGQRDGLRVHAGCPPTERAGSAHPGRDDADGDRRGHARPGAGAHGAGPVPRDIGAPGHERGPQDHVREPARAGDDPDLLALGRPGGCDRPRRPVGWRRGVLGPEEPERAVRRERGVLLPHQHARREGEGGQVHDHPGPVSGRTTMRTRNWIAFAAGAALLLAGPGAERVAAQDPTTGKVDNIGYGTRSAEFLLLPVGARAAALGQAFSALADDATALYWNPAGISFLHQRSAHVTHIEYLAETSYTWGGIAVPLGGGSWVVGAQIGGFNFGEAPVYTVEEPDGTGSTYSNSMFVVGGTLAMNVTDRFSFGGSVKYVQESLANTGGSALALDIGSNYHTEVAGRPFRAAFSILNLGGEIQLSGSDLIQNVGNPDPGTPDRVDQVALTTQSFP